MTILNPAGEWRYDYNSFLPSSSSCCTKEEGETRDSTEDWGLTVAVAVLKRLESFTSFPDKTASRTSHVATWSELSSN